MRPAVIITLLVTLLAAFGACDRRASPVSQPAPALALDAPWPDAGSPPALRAFTCSKWFSAPKAPQGPFTIRFLPRSARDVTFHIEYHCKLNCGEICDYSADLLVEDGRLKNAGLGKSFAFKCVPSPLTGFAVDCGVFLGSDFDVHVRASGVARTVSFRVPFFFDEGLPDRNRAEGGLPSCMPFVAYEKHPDSFETKLIDNKQLVFPLDGCRFSSDDEN